MPSPSYFNSSQELTVSPVVNAAEKSPPSSKLNFLEIDARALDSVVTR